MEALHRHTNTMSIDCNTQTAWWRMKGKRHKNAIPILKDAQMSQKQRIQISRADKVKKEAVLKLIFDNLCLLDQHNLALICIFNILPLLSFQSDIMQSPMPIHLLHFLPPHFHHVLLSLLFLSCPPFGLLSVIPLIYCSYLLFVFPTTTNTLVVHRLCCVINVWTCLPKVSLIVQALKWINTEPQVVHGVCL